MNSKKIMIAIAGSLLLSACQSTPPTLPTDTKWQAISINGENISGAAPTLQFKGDRRIAGFAGCNRYSAGIIITEDQFYITQPASTRMACPGDGMTTEREYLSTLQQMTEAEQVGDSLSFKSPGGGSILFERID